MSIKIKVYNKHGEETATVDVPKMIFGQRINPDLVHQAYVAQTGNERQVLAHAKGRSEVRGGGRKPWRQKGTGRARAGSSRSPIWRGGGVTFGPTKERNFSKEINKKMRQKALFMALTDKVKGNSLVVIDKLDIDEYKTKKVNEILVKLEKKVLKSDRKRSVLMVNGDGNRKVRFSARNLEGVKCINRENLNIVDLLTARNLVMTKEVVDQIVESYVKEADAVPEVKEEVKKDKKSKK